MYPEEMIHRGHRKEKQSFSQEFPPDASQAYALRTYELQVQVLGVHLYLRSLCVMYHSSIYSCIAVGLLLLR
jgi:hypothetical protein